MKSAREVFKRFWPFKRKCRHEWVDGGFPHPCVKDEAGEDTYSVQQQCNKCKARRYVIGRAEWHESLGRIKPTGNYQADFFAWAKTQRAVK